LCRVLALGWACKGRDIACNSVSASSNGDKPILDEWNSSILQNKSRQHIEESRLSIHSAFQRLQDLRRRDEEACGQLLRRKIRLVPDSEFEEKCNVLALHRAIAIR